MSAPTSMRAAVVEQFGSPLAVTEMDLPTPGPFQVLVKLKASGICHTALHAPHADWLVQPSPPFHQGHDGVGDVVELGPGEHDVTVGDRCGNA